MKNTKEKLGKDLRTSNTGLMLLEKCPYCHGEDIGLIKSVNRKGYAYKLVCNQCGYMVNILNHKQDIPVEESLLNVFINNKETNLVVDDYVVDKNNIELTVHRKEPSFKDMLKYIINEHKYPHHKRTMNKLNKIIRNQNNDFNYVFEVVDINNANVFIESNSTYDNPNYQKHFSEIMNVPLGFISHFKSVDNTHYLVVDCKRFYSFINVPIGDYTE